MGLKTTSQLLYRLMAAYTFIIYTLLSMNGGFCRLGKISSVILSFRFKQVLFWLMQTVLSYQHAKTADRWPHRHIAYHIYIIHVVDNIQIIKIYIDQACVCPCFHPPVCLTCLIQTILLDNILSNISLSTIEIAYAVFS